MCEEFLLVTYLANFVYYNAESSSNYELLKHWREVFHCINFMIVPRPTTKPIHLLKYVQHMFWQVL